MEYHNGMKFTTKDKDNDNHFGQNCADTLGPWWHNSCNLANLNGIYYTSDAQRTDGIFWSLWQGYVDGNFTLLRQAEMKIGRL